MLLHVADAACAASEEAAPLQEADQSACRGFWPALGARLLHAGPEAAQLQQQHGPLVLQAAAEQRMRDAALDGLEAAQQLRRPQHAPDAVAPPPHLQAQARENS